MWLWTCWVAVEKCIYTQWCKIMVTVDRRSNFSAGFELFSWIKRIACFLYNVYKQHTAVAKHAYATFNSRLTNLQILPSKWCFHFMLSYFVWRIRWYTCVLSALRMGRICQQHGQQEVFCGHNIHTLCETLIRDVAHRFMWTVYHFPVRAQLIRCEECPLVSMTTVSIVFTYTHSHITKLW